MKQALPSEFISSLHRPFLVVGSKVAAWTLATVAASAFAFELTEALNDLASKAASVPPSPVIAELRWAPRWDVGPGEHGDFPAKWMSADGRTLHLVFSGDDWFSVRSCSVVLRGK